MAFMGSGSSRAWTAQRARRCAARPPCRRFSCASLPECGRRAAAAEADRPRVRHRRIRGTGELARRAAAAKADAALVGNFPGRLAYRGLLPGLHVILLV